MGIGFGTHYALFYVKLAELEGHRHGLTEELVAEAKASARASLLSARESSVPWWLLHSSLLALALQLEEGSKLEAMAALNAVYPPTPCDGEIAKAEVSIHSRDDVVSDGAPLVDISLSFVDTIERL